MFVAVDHFFFLFVLLLATDSGECFEITFQVAPEGDGLIYFLTILLFSLYICTPVLLWTYHYYISKLAEKASKEIAKVSKQMSERLSDAGRKVSQSIRKG